MTSWSSARPRTVWKRLRALARVRPRDLAPVIGIKQGLTDPVSGMMMGDTAEKLAREYGISRDAQDLFALRSHQRATAAWNEGRLKDEVFTVYPEKAKGAVEKDIGPRDNQTLEALGKLQAVLRSPLGHRDGRQFVPGDRRRGRTSCS